MLTTLRVITSDGKYPERAKYVTAEHLANIAVLCQRVNALLSELGVIDVKINSGFRDASVTQGAPNSAHKQGMAVDLSDNDKKLSSQITAQLLVKHQLRREDNNYTPTWCHLDTRTPYGRIFKP